MRASILRRAIPKEAAALSQLALRSKGYWGYDARFLATCKDELTYNKNQLSSSAYCFNLAELEGKIISGFSALNFLVCDHPELEALFIDPEYIGQGLGKLLLEAAIDEAQKHRAKSIRIQSDPFAEKFYLANGATKVGETKSHSIPGRFLPQLQICL